MHKPISTDEFAAAIAAILLLLVLGQALFEQRNDPADSPIRTLLECLK